MRKTSEETVRFIVELLHSGYTPQEVVAAWANLRDGHDDPPESVSIPTVQRIAKQWGISQPVGGARAGAGRRKGAHKPPEAAKAAHALRAAGFAYQEIATTLHLRSRQHAQALCKRFLVGKLKYFAIDA